MTLRALRTLLLLLTSAAHLFASDFPSTRVVCLEPSPVVPAPSVEPDLPDPVSPVTASDAADTASEDNSTASVGSEPDDPLAGQATNRNAYLGSSIQFVANVTDADLACQWFKNGIPLIDDPRVQGSATATLTINTLSLADSGTYTFAVMPKKPVDCWGDSMTGGAYPSILSELSHLPVFNGGIGGQTSTQIRDRMLAATDSRDHHAIIWVGRNNPVISTVSEDIASMVAALGHRRYLVLGVTNADFGDFERRGGAGYNTLIALNQQLALIYGDHFVDIRAWLVGQGLAEAGISPTAQDEIDMADDLVPASLRGDAIHLNARGEAAAARKIFRELIRMLSTDSATKVSATPITLTVLPQDPIVTWRLANFAAGTPYGESANLEDPDHDGLSNLLEYALGSLPRESNILPTSVVRHDSFLTFTYPRIADPSITYTVEGATDLAGPWQAVVAPNNPLTGSASGLVSVTDTVSLDSVPRRFLRLRVKRAWPTDLLEAWRLVHFATTANSGDAADTADPDQDNLANLLEYATNTSPDQPDGGPTRLGRTGFFLTLTYQRIPDPALTYTVEGATNPAGPWTTIVAPNNPLRLSDLAGPVTVTDTLPLDGNPRRFLRLRVSRVWAADPLEAWRLTYFAASPDSGDAANLADPDKDGLPNLLEYATGTSPLQAGLPITVLGRSGSFLTFTYPRIADPALTYTVEGATTLSGPWATIETANNPLTGSDSSDLVTVTDTVPLGTTPLRFIRLRVSR